MTPPPDTMLIPPYPNALCPGKQAPQFRVINMMHHLISATVPCRLPSDTAPHRCSRHLPGIASSYPGPWAWVKQWRPGESWGALNPQLLLFSSSKGQQWQVEAQGLHVNPSQDAYGPQATSWTALLECIHSCLAQTGPFAMPRNSGPRPTKKTYSLPEWETGYCVKPLVWYNMALLIILFNNF